MADRPPPVPKSNSSSAELAVSAQPLPPTRTVKPWYQQDWLILVGLWLAAAIADGLWLLNDQSPPAWDQGEHLTRALNFWRVLQQPEWFDPDWWTTLWRQSPGYRAPLVYLATVPIFNILGRGFDQAVVVNTLFAGLLMGILYGLGRGLFGRTTGLWAAGLSLTIPMLYALRLDYLLDLGLVSAVTATFASLTGWRGAQPAARWGWAIAAGLGVGLSILAKPTAILFLVVPFAWIALESILTRPRWQHLVQWGLAAVAAWIVCGPWIQANWLTIITNSQSSNANWIPPELVPDSISSVLSYYARMLPRLVTYTLLIAGVLGGVTGLLLARSGRGTVATDAASLRWKWAWLGSFLLGSYGMLTLLQNKDSRHIAPMVPVLVLVLTRGLTLLPDRGGRWLRWGLAGLMVGWMVAAVLPGTPPPASRLMRTLYSGPPWPHRAVIETITTQAPYLRSTLGVIPNTAQVNPLTFDFYGATQDFRVYSRELGLSSDFMAKDARSVPWMLTKTGNQSPTTEAKLALAELVTQSPEFEVMQAWPLPDGSTLSLHHRAEPPVEVAPSDQVASTVNLISVTLPVAAAPGQTIPVTYELLGPWDALRHGLLVLSWQSAGNDGNTSWIHDHGIGLGQLLAEPGEGLEGSFTVIERLGMILPETLAPGTYTLRAEYLDRLTGAAQPLAGPQIALVIDPSAAPVTAPEPNLVGVLHRLSQSLAQGDVDPIFATMGRINQYDPIQDYLPQAELAMAHRLTQASEQLPWLYTQVMAQVLQQDDKGAIATLEQLTTLTPDNIYPWLYKGFVHLYAWQPRLADRALDQAAAIDATLPELQILRAVAALQQLNLWKTWRYIRQSGLLD
ncbi:glycosyltransferase family 39 protein [Leptolyngbya sp. CCNP1308]|uniref:glycosyltransferase family 39 protein n=1 Tax=Leptolyngbya sp. CCNP1308 TaxID=3110255 RepID=UPI002B1FA78A|nr:glycosyltransferase family 39 protein [Leptolyngbya sp. CCNP1308]MEA5450516.1 glycosyltransferase family 39 protein [Leptolyngbya sp. CCNP1308]